MSAKGISSIEKVSESLKGKGVFVSDEAISVMMDTAFSMLMDQIAKLNENISTLADLNVSANAELARMAAAIEKLQEEKRRIEDENKELQEKLRDAEAKNNRNSSNSNMPSSWSHFDKPKPSPRRSVIFSDDGKKHEKKESGGQKGHKGNFPRM